MSKVDYHLLNQQGVPYVSNSDKFLRYFVICLIGVGSIYWYCFSLYGSVPSPHFYSPSGVKSQESDVDSLIENWKERKPLCSAPEILNQMLDDPFIQKYTKKVSLECNKTRLYTKLDQETALLTLTDEAFEDEVSCFYSFLWRTSEQDNYIDYSEIHPIPGSGVQVTSENDIANVSCTRDGEEVYKNTHMWIPDLEPKVKSSSHGQPSVLVLFLESLSSVSFNRYMKKAKKSLENLGNVFYLNGFVKHNDNSFPNSVSMLTGDRIDFEYEEKVFKGTFFDDIKPKRKYLWDDFSSKGYVTGFLEDMAIVGIFNYAKWGWKSPPVDWYPRAFWVQMYPESGSFKIWNSMNELSEFCFNGPKVETFLDQVYSFMKKMNRENQPFFLFAFYSQMTHDDINNYQLVDEPFADFFERTKSMYNNTVVLFAGDHGPRYGSPSVPSGFGRLEERMNLVTVRVPECLDSKYPHLKRYLTANRDRLTSWIDVHEMVKDVALESFSPRMEVRKREGAISPWREVVHPSRTCEDASIFHAYCVCNGTMNTDPRLPDRYDIYWAYKTVEHFVQRAIQGAKKVEPEKYSDCIPEQKVVTNSTTHPIDMKYILPRIGENFMTDHIRISVFLEPSNVWLATEITVLHHADHFNIVDDEKRVLKVVCKT